MPATLATVIYALMILGLFFLNREKKSQVSWAVWIPVAWLSIGASRPISIWLGAGPMLESPDQFLDGSPLDAVIFAGLEMGALVVLSSRGARCKALLRTNRPLLVFFVYCAVSVLWSDFPFVALKRWVKATGNLVMILVVLTEDDPSAAVKRFLAHTGFLLIPLSALLIKYYPEFGRGFDPWTGRAFNVGVGMNKNGLGVVCMFLGLGALWQSVAVLRSGKRRRIGQLIAHGAVSATALWLFSMADSATAFGCFLVGGTLIVLAWWRWFARSQAAVHILTAAIISSSVLGVLVDTDVGLVQTMGRDSTLTDRTHLWEDVLRVPVNPLFGTGFESFWLGDRAKSLWEKYKWQPNQAHNGYLEVYLNSGWLGVALLGFVLAWGYRNVIDELYKDPELGGLRFALFMAAVLYNLTEAAFKVMHPVWIAFLLSVVIVPPRILANRRAAVPVIRRGAIGV